MARPLTVTAFGNAQLDTAESALSSQSSLLLDGTGDYITIPNDIIDSNANRYFDLGQGGGYTYGGGAGWRIDFWFKHNTGWSDSDILISSTSTNGGTGWYLQANLVFKNTFNTFTPNSSLYLANLNATGWNKLTLLSNGDYGQIYLNGNKLFTASQQNLGKILSGGDVVVVGAKKLPNGTVSNDYSGWIDELRINNSRGDDDTSNNTVPVETVQYSVGELFLSHFNGTDGSTVIIDTVPTTHSASANLTAFATELAVQNPSPSMVYLQNDVYTWADTNTWDSIYDGDDKWAVWERQTAAAATLSAKGGISNVRGTADLSATATLQSDSRISNVRGTANLSATATLSGTGRLLKYANLDITSLGDMTVFGVVDIKAKANITSTSDFYAKAGFLVGIDDPYDYTWDTVPDDQWNGFFTDQWRPNGWFAFDQVTLTGVGGLQLAGQADLTGRATVAVDARLSDVRGSADLAGQFALTSGSDNSKDGAATLEAFATEVTVARISDVRGSADLASAFTLQSGSDLYRNAASTLEAQANLATAGAMTLNARADFASEFALESNSRILKLANLDITSLGDLTVSAEVQSAAKVNLDANFDLTATAGYAIIGAVQLSTEFTQTVHPTLIPSVQLDEIAFNADLAVGAVMTYGAGAQLEAFASELTAGERLPGGKATITAEFTTVVTGSAIFGGGAQLEAFASELVAGRISDIRASATLAGTFVTEFAGELKLLDSQFIYKILSDTRTFAVDSEQRTYDVLSENKIFDVDSESRDYQVLPENRSIDVGYLMQ